MNITSITSIAKDKLLHFSTMAVFAALVYVVVDTLGARQPHLWTLGSAFGLAIGWEAWHKLRGGTNTKREMLLDIAAGMAGAIVVMLPAMLILLSAGA